MFFLKYLTGKGSSPKSLLEAVDQNDNSVLFEEKALVNNDT